MIPIRDVLFASRLRAVLAVVLLLVAALGGAVAAGVLGAPSVTGVENRFDGVNDTATTIESSIRVSNPNPVGANLGGVTVDYAVGMNDVRMAEGTKHGVEVASGESNVTLATRMNNERIPAWWVSHVKNGEHTDLAVHAQVRSETVGQSFDAPTITRDVDTDIISQFNSTETRAIRSERPLAPDPIVYVNETSAEWDSVTDERTPIRIAFEVYNPHSYPLVISELGYGVAMNDVAVGNGTTERGYAIPAKSSETVVTTVAIRNGELDEWWVSHLERNQVTDLRIDFHAEFDLGGGGTVRVPLDPLTYERTIETDIFGTKSTNASAAASGSTAGDESSTATPGNDSSGASDGATDSSDGSTDASDTTQTSESDDGGLIGGDGEGTASPTAAPTPDGGSGESAARTSTDEPTDAGSSEPTASETTTDDGGLLAV